MADKNINDLTAQTSYIDTDYTHVRRIDGIDYKISLANMKSDNTDLDSTLKFATAKAVHDLNVAVAGTQIPDAIKDFQTRNFEQLRTPVDLNLKAMAYGQGRFFAGGDYNATPARNMCKSTNNGSIWDYVTLAEANNITGMATDRAGTWVAVCSNGTNRIFRSTDNGDNWSVIAAPEANTLEDVATDGNGVWIIVCSDGTNRIFRSTNNGASWVAQAAPSARTWKSVSCDRGGVGTSVFIAASDGLTDKEVMRSVNAGASFVSITPITTTNISYKCIHTDENGTWIAAGISSANTNAAVSTDNGASWANVVVWTGATSPVQGCFTDRLGYFYLVASSSGSSINYQVFRTKDNGTNWDIIGIPNKDNFSYSTLYTGAYGDGVFILGGRAVATTDSAIFKTMTTGN